MRSLLSLLVIVTTVSGAVASPVDPFATMTVVPKAGYTQPPSHRPFPFGLFNHLLYPRANTNTAAPNPVNQLLYIAPTSNTCAGATYANECSTSSPSVVQAIVNGFTKYNVTTAEEQAALLSWMAYESADFKYNHNHFPAPGTPGKGTRTMMSPLFVQEYANSIPELQSKVAAIGTSASLTDAQADQILALVQPDEYSFAAAAWYYSTHCTDVQKSQVIQGGQNNWETAFLTGCVNTSPEDERVTYWQRACQALSVPVKQ